MRHAPPLIDADSHFMEPVDWLRRTNPRVADQVPDAMTPEQFASRVLAEVLAVIPEERRPSMRDLFSPGLKARLQAAIGDPGEEVPLSELERRIAGSAMFRDLYPKGAHDAADRVEVLDDLGIDVQLENPTTAIGDILLARSHSPELERAVIETYNTWATDTCAGHTDRVVPIVYVDVKDPEWAARELKRARGLGSRAFAMPVDPVGGLPLGDTSRDPVWAAAIDNGMLPVLHLGNGRLAVDPTWANAAGEPDARALLRMSGSQAAQLPQLALSSMVYGGVFDRFPDLVVLVEEFGLYWVEHWVGSLGPFRLDGSPNFGAWFGWDHARSPEEILRENLRFSPLVGQDVTPLLEAFGDDVVVFATDVPHPEGSMEAVRWFDERVTPLGTRTRERFFGGTMGDLLARGA